MVELTDEQIEQSIIMAKEAVEGIVNDDEEKEVKNNIRKELQNITDSSQI